MKDRIVIQKEGISVGGLLGILFIALKLIGVIHWPWVWVLSPFWIPLAFVLIILFICLIAAVLSGRKYG